LKREDHASVLFRVLLHVVLPLASGVGVYIGFRRVPAQALAWFPYNGRFVGMLPSRFVDVYPDAAWAYALTAFLVIVWGRTPGRAAKVWIACGPVFAAAWELGQWIHVVPGTFDIADLVFGVAAAMCAVFVLKPKLVDGAT
jgi:hypothetical protein